MPQVAKKVMYSIFLNLLFHCLRFWKTFHPLISPIHFWQLSWEWLYLLYGLRTDVKRNFLFRIPIWSDLSKSYMEWMTYCRTGESHENMNQSLTERANMFTGTLYGDLSCGTDFLTIFRLNYNIHYSAISKECSNEFVDSAVILIECV